MTHYTLHVPVKGKDNVKRCPRVGLRHFLAHSRLHALPRRKQRTRIQPRSKLMKPKSADMFENRYTETGDVYFTVRLDFPVGATELLAFPPRDREAGAVEGDPPGKEKAA